MKDYNNPEPICLDRIIPEHIFTNRIMAESKYCIFPEHKLRDRKIPERIVLNCILLERNFRKLLWKK